MEGRHGVEVGDEDGRDTVANDMEDRGSNQEPNLVRVLPLDTPDRLVVVEGDDRDPVASIGRDDLDDRLRLASEAGCVGRFGGQGCIGVMGMRVVQESLMVRVGAGGRSTGDEALPVGVDVVQ